MFSLINSVAEKWLDSASPDDVRSAKEAFKICFSKRADINEQDDHGLGATPLLHVVLVIRRIRSIGDELGLAHREDILQELQNLRTWLLSSGSNPYIQNKNGESAVDVDPEIKPKLKELVNELTDFRWDYYVDDGVDGKADGWYQYEETAWQTTEEMFHSWRTDAESYSSQSQLPALLVVQSGEYTYRLDFHHMTQTNTMTETVRQIRRVPL